MKATADTDKTDMPRKALAARARDVLQQFKNASGVTPEVIAKHTCSKCRERVFAPSINLLGADPVTPEYVTCAVCGHSEPFVKGGFSLKHATFDPKSALRFLGAIPKTDSSPERVIVTTETVGAK